jgi:hypothetical protein
MLRKTLAKALTLAAAALFSHAASADVLYTWQQTAPSASTPDGLHLELVFSDAAVAQGSFDLNLVNMCAQGMCDQQQDGLMALRYWYAGSDGGQQWNRIDYAYRDETAWGFDRLSLALSFLPNGQLSGSIFATDGASDFSMQSDGALFTLQSAHSDQADGCGFAYPSCGGEQGLLQADLKTGTMAHAQAQAVPEPAGLATLAIGALAGWCARRRSAGRRSKVKQQQR